MKSAVSSRFKSVELLRSLRSLANREAAFVASYRDEIRRSLSTLWDIIPHRTTAPNADDTTVAADSDVTDIVPIVSSPNILISSPVPSPDSVTTPSTNPRCGTSSPSLQNVEIKRSPNPSHESQLRVLNMDPVTAGKNSLFVYFGYNF